MVQSANYFEKKGKVDKAVTLYSRGGNRKKALELAMKHNLGHLIEDIPITNDNDDPEVMKSGV